MNDFLNAGSWLPYVALMLPLVIGLLVKSTASEKVKATTMLVITGISSLAYQVDQGGGVLTKEMAGAWLMSIVISIASYYGVWKPLGAGNIAPDKGIG